MPDEVVERKGAYRYVPHVYPGSGRVSTCFFNTSCGLKYVGMPLSVKCKNCDNFALKVSADG